MTGKCQTIGLETLPSFASESRQPLELLDAGWRRDDGQVLNHPIGNATLVAPAKAGIYWKRPDAGWRWGDGKCQTNRLETLPASEAGLAGGTGLVV